MYCRDDPFMQSETRDQTELSIKHLAGLCPKRRPASETRSEPDAGIGNRRSKACKTEDNLDRLDHNETAPNRTSA